MVAIGGGVIGASIAYYLKVWDRGLRYLRGERGLSYDGEKRKTTDLGP